MSSADPIEWREAYLQYRAEHGREGVSRLMTYDEFVAVEFDTEV